MLFLNLYENILVCQKLKTKYENTLIIIIIIPSSIRIIAVTCLHEAGIASNHRSAIRQWIRSQALYTLLVTLWELAMPEVVTLTTRRGMPKVGLVTGVKS